MAAIDLRSDTVTLPTPAMRRAMASAPVGDDVVQEDPTVNRLEGLAARLTGKQAALFAPSGTFANQCAILTFTASGNEVLLGERSHIVQHEAGAAALVSRVQLRPVSPDSPHLLPEDLPARIRGSDIHYPRTGLVCVEQATGDGTVVGLETLARVRRIARAGSIPVYMDGARLFNAAAALGVPVRRVAAYADAVSFCLSKGLCAPVGSVLCGSKDFIARARRNRKLMGGGMRQAGILAAAGLVALRDIRPRLREDHEKARLLAGLLREIPGVELLREPEINMVFVTLPRHGVTGPALAAALLRRGIKIYPDEGGTYRFVTHHHIRERDVRNFAREFARVLRPRLRVSRAEMELAP